ncbi:AAA family ATPase [Magnetococcus sp. PR-3]|uniref:AAA family ATPase n=1 Tax=Magnetococcus sp. PR-3 TaxID=3120355 RepID=UPI002FCE0EE1
MVDLTQALGGAFVPLPSIAPKISQIPEHQLHQELEAFGLINPDIIPDGALRRYGIHGDKPGEKNGWLVVFADLDLWAAAWGSWRYGDKHTWSSIDESRMTMDQAATFKARIEEARRRRHEEQLRIWEEKAVEAQNTVAYLSPAHSHPYLERKQVLAMGQLLSRGDDLLLPMRNAQGEIRSYQTIPADSEKKKLFMPGGEVSGCWFQIGDAGQTMVVCEGYATGSSIAATTGLPVAVAFNAGNLKPVAEALRGNHPESRIIIAGDEDLWTVGMDGKPINPGREKAEAAAKAVGGETLFPPFRDLSARPTDFNDLAVSEGWERVKTLFDQALTAPVAFDAFDVATLTDDRPPPRQWIVDQWIPHRETTLLYGSGGAGKSLLAMQIATCINLGEPVFGLKAKRGGTLLYMCEDDHEELHRRQYGINNRYGIKNEKLTNHRWVSRVGESNIFMTYNRDGVGVPTEVYRQFRAAVAKYRPLLVIVDTAADTFGGNENNRSQVNEFIKRLFTSIAKEFDCAVVILAHPSKSGEASGDGGSTAWNAAVRSRLFFKKIKGDKARLMKMKANGAKAAASAQEVADDEKIDLIWKDWSYILEDATQAQADPEHEACKQDFLRLLQDAIDDGVNMSNSPQSRTQYAPALMPNMRGAEGLKWTKSDYEEAMMDLYSNGVIGMVEYREGSSKSRKKGLRIIDTWGGE